MSVWKLAEMTWHEVRDLIGSRTAAIQPVGAIEAHGPHLPLATDVIIAEAMAREGARRLSRRGWQALILPAISYTTAGFARSFPGTIDIDSRSIEGQVTDLAASLARAGIGTMVLANSHFDPGHLQALHNAARRVEQAGVPRLVFPDLTRKPWGGRLTEEFRSGACHAGQYETSIVIDARPELVRETVRVGLRARMVSLSQAIADGVTSFEEAGGSEAYFGDPASASLAEGQATIATLGTILEEAVGDPPA